MQCVVGQYECRLARHCWQCVEKTHEISMRPDSRSLFPRRSVSSHVCQKRSDLRPHSHTHTHTHTQTHTQVHTHTLSSLTCDMREDMSVGESDTVSAAAAERDTKPALKTSGAFS